MKSPWSRLTIKCLGFAVFFVIFCKNATASTAQDLERVAQSITVKILESRCNPQCRNITAGSGIIVARRRADKTYHVLTVKHVIHSPEANYTVLTADGVSHPISRENIFKIDGTTIAMISFNSDRENYELATLFTGCLDRVVSRNDRADIVNSAETLAPTSEERPSSALCQSVSSLPDNLRENLILPQVLVAGYSIDESREQQLELTLGSLVDRDPQSPSAQIPLEGGYEFLYTNETYPGMSGGSILDTSGRVIGIHGQIEGDVAEGIAFGYSLGIPIETFLDFLKKLDDGYFPEFRLELQNLEVRRDSSSPIELTEEDIDLLLGGTVSNCIASDAFSVNELIEQSNRLYRLKEYNEALHCLDMALEIEYKPFALYAKGVILAQMGKFRDSLSCFTAATQIDPNYYVALRWRGIVLNRIGRYLDAETLFNEAIEAYKNIEGEDYIQARNGLVESLNSQGRFRDALDAQTLAIQDSQDNPAVWVARSRALNQLGRYTEALESLERAGELGTDSETFFTVFNEIGSNLKEEGLIERAEFNLSSNQDSVEFRYEIEHRGSSASCSVDISNDITIRDYPVGQTYQLCLTPVLDALEE